MSGSLITDKQNTKIFYFFTTSFCAVPNQLVPASLQLQQIPPVASLEILEENPNVEEISDDANK